MAKIYISSTYLDLKDYRAAAAKALGQLGYQAICMENYVACDDRPLEKCLRDVRNCDAYIGILAWRYGYIPDGYDKSITHLEYATARKKGIPCYIFLLDENTPWLEKFIAKGEESRKRNKFKAELEDNHMRAVFKNKDELGWLISSSLANGIGHSEQSPIKFPKKEELAPSYCDRQKQVEQFEEFFRSNLKKNPYSPHFYIIHGNDAERHQSLFARLKVDFLDKCTMENGDSHRNSKTKIVEIPWVKRNETQISDLKKMYISIVDRTPNADEFSFSELPSHNFFCKMSTVVIYHEITSDNWGRHTLKLMCNYIRSFWEELVGRCHGPKFFVFFYVRYKRRFHVPPVLPGKYPNWFDGNSHIRKGLKQISGTLGEEIPCLVLRELGPIQKRDVTNWIIRSQICHDLDERDDILNEIFQENGKVLESKCMKFIEKKLFELLNKYNSQNLEDHFSCLKN